MSNYNHENIIEKFHKLKHRITFATHGTQELTELNEVMWVKRKIGDLEDGVVLDKTELTMANLYWKKYGNGGVQPTNENMWEMIDGMLTQENPSKIGAIKMYRRFITNASLRESKEVVDAREQKLKRGW